MSEINDKDRARPVPMPDIYPVSRHEGMPSPNGPRNRVGELALAPFSQFGGQYWEGEDVSVLTLWTDHPTRSPFRFCFSREGLELLRREIDGFLNKDE